MLRGPELEMTHPDGSKYYITRCGGTEEWRNWKADITGKPVDYIKVLGGKLK